MDPTVSFPADWKPPRELARALPRETRISGRGMAVAIAALVLLVAAVAVYLVLHNQARQQAAHSEELRTVGREASGEIERLWHEGKASVPMVTYAFTADGARILGESSVPAALWADLRKAGFLPVRYLPSNPTVNHPAAWAAAATPAWLAFFFPAWLAAGGIFLLTSLKRQAEMAAEGVAAVGVVTRCFRVKAGWRVRYQFRAQEGAVSKGSDQVLHRPEVGATVCVLYLPRNPRRNRVYPMLLYRVTP
jgi:hypothetical protein